MSPEKLFKLLQVAIVVAPPRKALLAVFLPMRKKLLQGVPAPQEDFALLFWFQRRRRLRTVAINVQSRNASILSCVIQRPTNFILRSRGWPAIIRHLQARNRQGAEARPEDTEHQIKVCRVRNLSPVVRLRSKALTFPEKGA